MDFLWGTPLMILMIGVGLYLSIGTKVFQVTGIGRWWKKTIVEIFGGKHKSESAGKGELTPFQTISTVLAGIYAAALFIFICADACFVQMNTLSVCINDVYGNSIRSGLGAFGESAEIAVRTFLGNSGLQFPMLLTGIIVVVISFIIIQTGGLKTIGGFCEKMVPSMICIYIIACIGVVVCNLGKVPEALGMIFKYAFAPAPAIGGFAGATLSLTMARGVSRGIFSNEAGMGTAATIHATARTDHPVHQGMYGILEVFVTIVICTLTALTVLCSGVWCNGRTGVELTFDGFKLIWGQIGIIVLSLSVFLFAFSSYIGYYVEFRTCVEYLFGKKFLKSIKYLYFILPLLAVTLEVEQVWDIADIAVGFIVLPNMIALIALSPKFFKLFREYKS